MFEGFAGVSSLRSRLASCSVQHYPLEPSYQIHFELRLLKKGSAHQRPVLAFSRFRFQECNLVVLRTSTKKFNQTLERRLIIRMDLTQMKEPGQGEIQTRGVLIFPS